TQFLEKKQNGDETAEATKGGAATGRSGSLGGPSDKSQPDPQSAPTTSFVIVKAANMVYTDQDRLAHYTGAVVLNRPGLQVKADDLRAILAESKAESKTDAKKEGADEGDSRIEKAYADGHVEIVQ